MVMGTYIAKALHSFLLLRFYKKLNKNVDILG